MNVDVIRVASYYRATREFPQPCLQLGPTWPDSLAATKPPRHSPTPIQSESRNVRLILVRPRLYAMKTFVTFSLLGIFAANAPDSSDITRRLTSATNSG